MNKYELGQDVYCSHMSWRNLKVSRVINEHQYECKGEMHYQGTQGFTDGWHPNSRKFYYFELKDTPFEAEKDIHVRSKWNDLVSRTEMVSPVRGKYRDFLDGELDLSPEYQRGLVWTLEQKQSYIKNLFLEKAVITPTIILNWDKDNHEVLDGKQRLTTVFDFIDNKFPLESGEYFKDLSRKDAHYLLNHEVRFIRVEKRQGDLTLAEKIELFLEINELGTKMDESHLDKVKEMIK